MREDDAPADVRARPVRSAPRPGTKQARYRRWKRAATVVTALALVGFAAALVAFVTGDDGAVGETRGHLAAVAAALRRHHEAHDALPDSLAGLASPGSDLVGESFPEDAWGRRIELHVVDRAGGRFRLRSLGADGAPGTPDDLIWPAGAAWE